MSRPRGEPFGTVPLPDILCGLNCSRATGVLEVHGASAVRELVVVEGELRAARSDAEDEKLGSWLVDRGVISAQDKRAVLASQEGSDASPFGHILVRRRLISEGALSDELERLALQVLERATADERKHAVFLAGERGTQLDTLPRLATAQLILHCARALPDVQAKRSAIACNGDVVCVNDTVDSVVQQLDLEMAEAILVGKLHRERTLEALQAIAMLPEHQFVSALYALKMAGVVGFRGAAEAPRAPAAQQRPEPSRPQLPPDVITDHEIAAEPRQERQQVIELASRARRLDHYELLGVDRHETYRKIFDAWDEFRRRHHPDRAAEAHLGDVGEQLKKLYEQGEEAFEILSSPERRPRYDRMIQSSHGPTEGSRHAGPTGPDLARANTERAEELARQGDLFQAIRLLEQACDLDPRPGRLLRLAQLMLVNPQWSNRALEKLRRAVEIDPTFIDGWLEVAGFWHRRRSPERERKALERALAAQPTHTGAAERYERLVGSEGLRRFLARVRQ